MEIMTHSQTDRTKLFISYSHADADWLERLQVHLKPLEREGRLERWDDTRIAPGEKWEEAIRDAIASAKVAVLLVSADFLASDFIATDELPPLLAAAEQDGAVVLPLILSPSQFKKMPSLAQFQSVNPPSKPLISLTKADQEAVLVQLADAIEQALQPPVTAPQSARKAEMDSEDSSSSSHRSPGPFAASPRLDVIGWLRRNKEWVFSGVGVAIVAAILSWFLSSSEPSSNIRANGGIAAGGDIKGSKIEIINTRPDPDPGRADSTGD